MATNPISFTADAIDVSDVIAALTDLGFVAEPPRSLRLTRLDTFDGRLRRAGLQLTLHESETSVLVLAGTDAVEAHLAVAGPPSFATDLPPGPFRARLAPVIDVRALRTQIELAATHTPFVARNVDGGAAATASLYTSLAVVGIDAPAAPPVVVEVHEVLGHPKPARGAITALTALGAEPFPGDSLSLVANAADIDTTGFSASPTVPLDPEMPAVEGFGRVLTNLAETITANWDGTVDHVDPEFLHDLRVAVRRTRTVLAQAKRVLPATTVATARERFAELAAATGPARDLDVFSIEWERYVRPFDAATVAALEPAHELLEERRAEALTDLAATLRSSDDTQWMITWQRLLTELVSSQPRGGHADRVLGGFVAKRIERAQQRLLDHGRAIGPEAPAEQVHRLRKDAKKLRYLLECFGSILPERPRKRFVKRLKALQNNLGEHQDAEVHGALISDVATIVHARGAPPETLVALGRLSERLDQARIAARAELADRFGSYDTAEVEASLDEVVAEIRR